MHGLSILLADYHTMFRQGLKALLEAEGFRVAAEASHGREAVQLARQHRPDVAVLDLDLPILNGIGTAEAIKEAGLDTRTVVLAMHDDPAQMASALRAGVRGYILKGQAGNELVECIRQAARGATYLSPGLPRSAVDAYLEGGPMPGEALNSRELQVIRWIAEGKRTREIARLLGLSPKTVESQRSRIMRKLDIHETAGLVRFAIRHHLTDA